jgi:hypothetical protein
MNRISALLFAVIPAALLLAAVPAPSAAANNPTIYIPAPIQVPCDMSVEKVRASVRAGVLSRGWIPKDMGTGEVEATLDKKGRYLVVIAIHYDVKSVKIEYKSSEGLDYEGSGAEAKIKRGYNSWIRNIEKDISIELSKSCG